MSNNGKHKIYLSVVICTYKRPDHARECIRSVLNNVYDGFEVIVVCQGNDDETKKLLEREFTSDDRVVPRHIPAVGLSGARNAGLHSAKGEIVAFIDDDATAGKHWIEGYADIFQDKNLAADMVGGRIRPRWETHKPEWYPESRAFLLGIYDIGDEVRMFPEHDLPVGANFAVRRDVLLKVGGFDTRLGFNESRKNAIIAGEDSLVGLKARDAGCRIFYQPKAEIFHFIDKRKLTRKFFLRRHYWEGVSQMIVRECMGMCDKDHLKGVLKWQAGSMFKTAKALIVDECRNRGKDKSRKMLGLADLALSLGVCKQSLGILLRAK